MLSSQTPAHQKNSLRFRLTLWFGSLSLLTLLCVGLYVGSKATEQMQRASGEALHSTARAAAELLGNQLYERELEIVLLSQEPHFVRGNFDDPDVIKSLQRRRQVRREYAWIGVADAAGTVRQAADGLLVGNSVTQRPWFQSALKNAFTGDVHEAILLAKLLPANTNGEPLRFIDFAAPIHDATGQVVGVLGAHAHWRWVTDSVESAVHHQGMKRKAEVLILDKDGAVLYPQHLVGKQQLMATTETATTYASLRWSDDRTYLTSIQPVDAPSARGLGWKIAVRQPLDEALQDVHMLRNQLFGAGVIAALLFAALAYWLAQRVSQPIERLVFFAQKIQARAPDVPVLHDDGVREIALLNESFQSMTQSLLDKEHALLEANATLDATVQVRTAELTQANAELERLATEDALTGVNNRRRLDEKLVELEHLYHRTHREFALLMIDADHFKRVNDTHGHAAGDTVLRALARQLQASTRSTDFVARFGGEEFVILLPDLTDAAEAIAVAEKIRHNVKASQIDVVGQVTVSIGVALMSPSDIGPESLLERADQALYQAKSAGRNKVVYLPSDTGIPPTWTETPAYLA
ncbi:MAG: GGDEF domain-containing protein [Burkholderiales bacterium PBB3]|nr:MAG: GGDEF domain-containing protein [Burkholderiales bacterium PBB3]